MPLYEFQCTECDHRETLVAATFEDIADCSQCGGLMLRLDDPFIPHPCAWCLAERGEQSPPGVSHGICHRHQAEILKEI